MKNTITIFTILFLLFVNKFYAQSITNTLGAGGLFKITDATTDFFILSQSNGTITLPVQLSGNQRGSIFKGTNRFLHTYFGAGTAGNNLFLGVNAGNFTMDGVNSYEASCNTGVGDSSLSSNTTGFRNSAFGYSSLQANTTGFANSAFGYQSLYENTTGFDNSAFGYSSLQANTTGDYNSAFGNSSLGNNTTGDRNSAFGGYSLQYNTTGFDNSAFGYSSLQANTTGDYNSAFGYSSLDNNTTGVSNSAFGYQSLYENTTGYTNSAFGNNSLENNTTGNGNSAMGYQSLLDNTSGGGNSAYGFQSIFNNTTGDYNSAFGTGSLSSNTTGSNNSTFGYTAGSTITTGSNLTCLGYNAEPTSGSATNQITLGNSSVTSLRCAVTTITSLSDRRDKKNIKDLNLGIDFLMKLKPRQYNWDKREWYENNISDGSKMNKEPTAGFIAQELDEAQITANAEWLNLVLKDNPEKWEATPGNLLPIIVKAVQELKAENDELTIKNEKLKIEKDEEIAELKTRLSKYEEMQTMLVKRLEYLESNEQNFKVQIVKSEEGSQ